MKNKIVSCLLILVFVFSILPADLVSAISNPIISVTSISGNNGDVVNVDVNISECSNLCSGNFEIVYDNTCQSHFRYTRQCNFRVVARN